MDRPGADRPPLGKSSIPVSPNEMLIPTWPREVLSFELPAPTSGWFVAHSENPERSKHRPHLKPPLLHSEQYALASVARHEPRFGILSKQPRCVMRDIYGSPLYRTVGLRLILASRRPAPAPFRDPGSEIDPVGGQRQIGPRRASAQRGRRSCRAPWAGVPDVRYWNWSRQNGQRTNRAEEL